MKAIVLSGGGAKGSYELGVWKALRRLRIKYDIVTGTSIGALNGLLMAQKQYYRCFTLWNNIDFNQIYDDFDATNMYKSYMNKLVKGGIDTNKIATLIDNFYNPNKLYNSKIKFGVVSVNLTDGKVKYSTTENTKPEKLSKYILASATCFPFFKPLEIDNKMYVDGGYYDNLPINLAIDLGATEIIAVDLRAIGLRKKAKDKNIKITYISPNGKLDSFLNFEKNATKKMFKLGYNDAMKVFDKLEGNVYTFKKNTLHLNYFKYKENFSILTKKNLNEIITEKDFNKVIEDALGQFEIDVTKIYKKNEFNLSLLERLKKYKSIEIDEINAQKIKKLFDRKTIIKNIYERLLDNKDCTIFKILKKDYLIALYLIVIGGIK